MGVHSYCYHNGVWTNDVEKLRVTAGLTQTALCEMLGLSVSRYRRWTDGRGKPLEEAEIEQIRGFLTERLRCLDQQP